MFRAALTDIVLGLAGGAEGLDYVCASSQNTVNIQHCSLGGV